MTPAARPAALLLDLDGVLVDTELPALTALTVTFHDYGVLVEPDEVARRFRGRNLDHCPDELAVLLGGDVPDSFVPEARRRARCGRPPRAEHGAAPLLAASLPWRIVTNSTRAHSLATLEAAGLGDMARPEVIVAVDRGVARPKPAPDLYLAAAADLGVEPSACLAVEDSLTGLRAARAAGVPALGYAPHEAQRRRITRAGFACVRSLHAVPARRPVR